MILATLHQALLTDELVFLADPGSNVPHSVMVDGVIEELIDPPTLKVTAGPSPIPISERDFI